MVNQIQPMIFRSSKRKHVLLLLGCLVFVVIGISIGRSGHWLNYFGVAFFGLGVLVGIINLIPGASYLEIKSDGFTFSSLFRKHFIPWLMVDEFYVLEMGRWPKTKMIGYNCLHSKVKASRGQKFSKFLSGVEEALPDTYGKKAEELLDIMNTCLAKARSTQAEAVNNSVTFRKSVSF
jgi:hypothetical protein